MRNNQHMQEILDTAASKIPFTEGWFKFRTVIYLPESEFLQFKFIRA